MKQSQKTLFQIIALLILIVVPLIFDNAFYMDMIINIFLWAFLAGAWNLTAGYGGLLSIGHAAFFGIGAYTSTILFVNFGLSPWIGMLIGGILASITGIALGYITIRLQGPFFSLATMAFGEIMIIVAVNLKHLTNGSQGITIPFEPSFVNFMFRGKVEYFYIGLALCLIPVLIAKYLERSKLGYYLMAIRENEAAARSLGVGSVKVKLVVTAIGAFLTAVAGTYYAQYMEFIEPYYIFSVGISVQIALMAIIGGMGTPYGPILGAILISVTSTYLRSVLGSAQTGVHMIVYGLVLVIIVILVPSGLISLMKRKRKSQLDNEGGNRAIVRN